MLEPLLAYLHLAAMLAMFVFLTSQAALCRVEWLNAAAVRRLVRVDLLYWIAVGAVLATGLIRVLCGAKGMAWYGSNWLLHVKFTGLLVMAILSIGPSRVYRRWLEQLNAAGALPAAAQIGKTRKLVMLAAHFGALLPLAASFMARGWGA